jgi:hypothetical protein
MQYTDYNQANTWQQEVIAMYTQARDVLHAAMGPNFQVGANTGTANIALVGDWTYAETWLYGSYYLANSYLNSSYSSYDSFLPANNPGGSKAAMLCMDTADSLFPGLLSFTAFHYWDRANRSPIGCLAQHYVGSNTNTGFSYYTQGGFIYGDTDEVFTFGPATTISAPVPADTTSQTKTISLASGAGCSAMVGGYYAGSALLRLGTTTMGDTVYGRITGTTFTTTSKIYNPHAAGDPAYCIQGQHQSLVSPPADHVWKWSTWFPAMGVDIGPPDPNGLSGGARIVPWKTGGGPDYISGQARATCDAKKGYCADLLRRDFTKAIILMRPWVNQSTLESEVDTPSQPVDLGGVYYPLRADGTTGPGVTRVTLRAAEAAILMKNPILPQGPSPICDAGPQQTLRAGHPAQLDGSRSNAKDGGGGLTYFWQQLSGPKRVRWSSRSAPQPTVTGLVFGSYVFQLTVTDGSGQSGVCTVKHGAVATDDSGVVITNNAAVDALLGPLVRLGENPWPWFDDRHKADADLQIAGMDTNYPAWWDAPGPGTVTVTGGSSTLTGNSTTFTTTFCQGPGSPNTPKSGAAIAVWYNTGVSGQTGRRMSSVTGCADDTHLTVDDAWDGTGAPAGSGLNYAADDGATHYATNWGWGQADSPGNYYDNVAAYYALYYRSGIDDYLVAARKLADRVWRSPMVDRGASLIPDHSGRYGFTGRSISAMGLALRALELQGTPSDMWPGLHRIWDAFTGYLNSTDKNRGPGMWDTREEAYHLAMISYCAMLDTDPAYRSNCKATVSNSFANIWTPFLNPDGSWPQLFASASSWDTQTSVSLANGSKSVVGNGTLWTAGNFPGTIWFTNDPHNGPPNNSAGDSNVYTATFVDATHLMLERPYEGTSGTHGWATISGSGLLGWGAQPTQTGLLAAAFDLAAKAVADTYPGDSALAHQYNVTAANWIRTYGYWPLKSGMYTGAQGVNCRAPISDNNVSCTGGNAADQARVLSAEALRGVMTAYAYSHDGTLRDFADTLYNAMFAKPGTCPAGSAVCAPDGAYLTGMDAGGSMMTSSPPEGNKWLGMFFGFNNLSAWPAYRGGGLQPFAGQTAYVAFNLGGVRGAMKARITATEPSGKTDEIECSSSPCAVTLDRRQGKHLIEVKYLSGSGSVLASTEIPL